MQNRQLTALLAALLLGSLCAIPGQAARQARKGQFGDESAGDLYAAVRLLRRAGDLMEAGERDRAVKMLETVIDRFPRDAVRFKAYMGLGKHYLEVHEQSSAIENLRNVLMIRKSGEDLQGEDLNLYLEALYLIGLAHFQTRDYAAAFAVLRQITSDYPDTVWANEAYYYIGMSHFAQQHWNKAIEALSRVGTLIDPNSDAVQFVEAGRRFYLKVLDGDLPVLERLGETTTVSLDTASGDRETVQVEPMTVDAGIHVGSIGTSPGAAVPDDGTVQIIGSDKVTVRYIDCNTQDGSTNVLRQKEVKVVSSAAMNFTLGSYKNAATAAYLDQPVFLRLRDLDLDKSPQADQAAVRITARYEKDELEEDEPSTVAVDIETLLREENKQRYTVRDEVTIQVAETGEAPVHSGLFVGSCQVALSPADKAPDRTDNILSCELGDEIVATYVDELNIAGAVPLQIEATLPVVGEIDSAPRVARNVVPDPILESKKNLVEAEAYLELAKIFKSMGLMKGARDKAAEGLDKADGIVRTHASIPPSLRQEAFRIKWELHLAEDDFRKAMATCQTFNRLYPESPLVDRALMGIAGAFIAKKEYNDAIGVLQQVLGLPFSHSKAEAQYTIAELSEEMSGNPEAAIHQYTACAKNFPNSRFAGPSLGKMVDYHITTKDFTAAEDLLQQIFLDYPDEDFLDSMLLKWVLVAYRMGNYELAYDKCTQLISEYPGSKSASKAKEIMPRIQARLGKGSQNES